MGLLEQSSLCITPNAVKAGKLYSVIPNNGTGDLDVVRATSATRVNEQGLVEIPRTNLLTRSEEFDNAAWIKTGATITPNVVNSPIGTLSSDLLLEDSSTGAHQFSLNTCITDGVVKIRSIYLKKYNCRYIALGIASSNTSTTNTAMVDLDTKTIINIGSTILNVSIVPLQEDWVKVSWGSIFDSTFKNRFTIALSTGLTYTETSYTGTSTLGVYIWGAQLEAGNVATEYIPTTSVIRTRFAGITQDGGSASKIPRLDYTNGSCPSILVEPQRTNLFLRSEEFDTPYWNKTAGSTFAITQNSILSPSGTMTADKITPSSNLTTHWIGQTGFTLVSGTTYAFSVFAKNNGYNLVLSVGDFTVYTNCNFNLDNGTASTPLATSGANLCSPSIQNFGNGWYRCTIIFTAWTNSTFLLFSVNNTNSTPSGPFGMATITGDNSKGFYLWGAQLEAGSNATSYIPTVASTVTRNADVISKSGISSLIGQTEGTIYLKVKYSSLGKTSTGRWFKVYGASNEIALAINGVNVIRSIINNQSDTISTLAPRTDTGVKIAWAYNASGVVLFVNGVEYALPNGNAQVISSLDSILFDASVNPYFAEGIINQAILFKTRLSNTELAQLTTL